MDIIPREILAVILEFADPRLKPIYRAVSRKWREATNMIKCQALPKNLLWEYPVALSLYMRTYVKEFHTGYGIKTAHRHSPPKYAVRRGGAGVECPKCYRMYEEDADNYSMVVNTHAGPVYYIHCARYVKVTPSRSSLRVNPQFTISELMKLINSGDVVGCGTQFIVPPIGMFKLAPEDAAAYISQLVGYRPDWNTVPKRCGFCPITAYGTSSTEKDHGRQAAASREVHLPRRGGSVPPRHESESGTIHRADIVTRRQGSGAASASTIRDAPKPSSEKGSSGACRTETSAKTGPYIEVPAGIDRAIDGVIYRTLRFFGWHNSC